MIASSITSMISSSNIMFIAPICSYALARARGTRIRRPPTKGGR